MNLLLIFLLSIKIFPDNSQDFTAYAIGFGGCEIGYQICDIFLSASKMDESEKEFVKIPFGVISGCVAHFIFQGHFENNDEHAWVSVGKGHHLVVRVSVATIKHFLRKKKDSVPTLMKEEKIEFYLKRR